MSLWQLDVPVVVHVTIHVVMHVGQTCLVYRPLFLSDEEPRWKQSLRETGDHTPPRPAPPGPHVWRGQRLVGGIDAWVLGAPLRRH